MGKYQNLTLDQPMTYQISVPGHIEEHWLNITETITIAMEKDCDGQPHTSLTCTVDQAALHSILRRLYSLGLPLISVLCLAVD